MVRNRVETVSVARPKDWGSVERLALGEAKAMGLVLLARRKPIRLRSG